MNLENEYFTLKQELKIEEEKLAKFENTKIVEDENNPFTIEEMIESKNRGIASCKESIIEITGLINEVKEELIDFVDNGGEVSEKTLKELNEEETSSDDSFSVDFKVLWNKNPQVYFEGYVNIPSDDCEDEEIEWYYYNAQGFATNNKFIEHDGVDGFKGSTDEQEYEINQFKDDFLEDSFWIDECICQSDADENRTYVRENCTLIINEGAKMECEINEKIPYRGDFIVELIPKFNGKKINLIKYMNEMNETFDPYGGCDENFSIEDGHIYFEMSKDYWDGDSEDKEYNMNVINEEARMLYAKSLTYELGVYGKYGEIIEQALDDNYDDNWLFQLSQLNQDNLKDFLIEQGIIG